MNKDERLALMYPLSKNGSWLDSMQQELHLPQDVEHLRKLALTHYTVENSLEKLSRMVDELGKVNFTEPVLQAIEHLQAVQAILTSHLHSLEQEIDEKTAKVKKK